MKVQCRPEGYGPDGCDSGQLVFHIKVKCDHSNESVKSSPLLFCLYCTK